MRKPGQPDTLIKLATLGGGGVGVAGFMQQEANEKAARDEKETMQNRDLAEVVSHFKKLKLIQELKEKGEYVEPNPEDAFNDGMPEPGESSYE